MFAIDSVCFGPMLVFIGPCIAFKVKEMKEIIGDELGDHVVGVWLENKSMNRK